MDITLEMLDEVRNRTGVSYEKAVEALQATNGNVVEAIVMIERQNKVEPEDTKDELYEKGVQVVGKVRDMLSKGNNIRVKIKNNDDTVVEVPATVGIIGTLAAPQLAVLGAAACLLTRCSVEVENKNKKEETSEVSD